ncbi:DUF551 domain-containing protein [Citrobacter freundii]|uniref:DUF551 domain-containing protein n=1 Tax=Citrobacter freundii TaxID=546 RepID=UPI0015E90E8D|nr:DUF551 domain-containing protein [Citrobacter freundii]QLX05659.1 DUF551 domain-containing protein [Citrobacter freundii]
MTTNNHPAHGPVSLDRLHQISEILSKAAAQSDGGNLGYAMADAVKVIDEVLEARNSEPVGAPDAWLWVKSTGYITAGINRPMYEPQHSAAIPLYAAPPATVVPEPATVETTYPDVQTNWQDAKMYAEGWNACRATMLQADNHTEQHLDMVDHSGDDNEKSDCKLPFDQWLSQQNEPIDVDCGCVTSEAFYHWLRVAYEAGNSPVTPDVWVACSERMPEGMTDVHISNGHDVGQGWWDGDTWQTQHDYYSVPGDVTHWTPLPAAPQQEVKSALEHGMRRYAGAMQKLSEWDD